MSASSYPLHDPEAFSNLYARTQIVIFRYIYGLYGGPVEEVEDLACDTYMRAWKGRDRFNGSETDALSWLFTIARNLVIDAHRRNKTHPHNVEMRLDDFDMDDLIATPQATPEEVATYREQIQYAWKLMQGLPEDRREMLVLRYMVGWQVKQIAQYLHREENTVTVYIRRSLDQIRTGWVSD